MKTFVLITLLTLFAIPARAQCKARFDTTFVTVDGNGQMTFAPHHLTQAQLEWWVRNGKKKYGVVVCESLDDADYLIAVSTNAQIVTTSGIAPIVSTTNSSGYASGTVQGPGGTSYVSANANGTAQTVTWVPVSHTQTEEQVYAYVFKISRHTPLLSMSADKMPEPVWIIHKLGRSAELGQGRTVFEHDLSGAEKATFEDALKFIEKQ